MAPDFVGSPITISDSADSGSQTVTVPAGATLMVVVGGWWDNGGDFTSMSQNGSALTKITSVVNTGYDHTLLWELQNPSSGTFSWAKADGASSEGAVLYVLFFETADSVRDFGIGSDANQFANATTASFDSSTDDLVLCVVSSYAPDQNANASGSGQTAVSGTPTTHNSTSVAVGYKAGVSGTTTMSGSGSFISIIGFSIAPGVAAPVLEQEGFAFGDDDGNEASHTLDTQDVNASAEVEAVKTLRLLLDTTNDAAATAYTLHYQKNGTGGYTAVPVGSGGKVQPVIESADVTESGNNTATSSWAVSRPTAATGDLLLLIIGWDDSTNNTGITVGDGPNGETWTPIDSVIASASTEVRMTAYYVVATGSWGAGTITVTPNASEQWTAAVALVPAGEFDAATPIGAAATRASSGTAESNALSPAMTAGATDGSGTLIFAATTDADPLTTLQSGYTSIANTDRGAVALGVAVRDTAVANSESIAGGDTWALASDSWCSLAFVVRAPSTTNEIYVTPSANVAAGGEATTARLSAPAGKTTGDFTTGRRWDDENGTDEIDIGADGYTELEWVLTTQSPAAVDDYYDFRVYAGAAALDTYTVTPRLTLIASGGNTYNLAAVVAVATATPSAALKRSMALTAAANANTNTPAASLSNILAAAAAVLAVTSSTDTAVLSKALNFAAVLAAASNTPAAALGVGREMASSSLAVSATPDNASLLRAISLALTMTGSSATPDTAALLKALNLSSSATAASATPDNLILQAIVSMSATLTAVSSTPASSALSILRALTAVASANSSTDAVILAVARQVSAAVVVSSITPDTAVLSLSRELAAAMSAATVTADGANLRTVLEMAAALTGATATSSVALVVSRAVSAAISGQSVTPSADLAVARALQAVATAVTATNDTAVLGLSRQLAAAITAQSVTPDSAALATILALAAGMNAQSATPNAALGVGRALAAALLASSSTGESDLAILRAMSATLTAVSSSNNAAALAVAREMVSAMTAQSATSTADLLNRLLWAAALAAATATSDDADLSVITVVVITGLMHMTFSLSQPTATFGVAQPTAAFAIAQPNATFDINQPDATFSLSQPEMAFSTES